MGKAFFTGISNTGQLRVGYIEDGVAHGVVVDNLPVDDHSGPCILAQMGKPTLAFWATLGFGTTMRYKKSASNEGLDFGPLQAISFGSFSSYKQVYREPDTDNILLIAGRGWHYARSLDYGDTWGASQQFVNWLDDRGYMITAQNGTTIHCALNGHPSDSNRSLYYFRFDLSTGAAETADGTSLGNIYDTDDIPIDIGISGDAPAAYTPTGSGNTRIFDVSATGEIAFAEWEGSGPATYCYLYWDGSDWVKRELVGAGVPFGYQTTVRYLGGMAFPNPTSGGELFLVRENSGTWTLEKWTSEDDGATWDDTVLVTETEKKLARPHCPIDANGIEVMYHLVHSYSGPKSFSADLKYWPTS